MSDLLTHTAVRGPRRSAVSSTLSMSLMPDREGSATTSTVCTPVIEAITGHPIPGDPSIMAKGAFPAAFFICFLTSVTRSPVVPLPILSRAVENIPLSVSE